MSPRIRRRPTKIIARVYVVRNDFFTIISLVLETISVAEIGVSDESPTGMYIRIPTRLTDVIPASLGVPATSAQITPYCVTEAASAGGEIVTVKNLDSPGLITTVSGVSFVQLVRVLPIRPSPILNSPLLKVASPG
jgi:hypothetical protein